MSPKNILPKKKYDLNDCVCISHKSRGSGCCKEGTVIKISPFFTYIRDTSGAQHYCAHCFINKINMTRLHASLSLVTQILRTSTADTMPASAPAPVPAAPRALLASAALECDAEAHMSAARMKRTAAAAQGITNDDLYRLYVKQKEQIELVKLLIKDELENINLKFNLMMEKLDEVGYKIDDFIEGT